MSNEIALSEDSFETTLFTREECPIDHVTVYSSSAEITRNLEKEIIEPGEYHFSLRDLPQDVQENSVRVKGKGKATILELWTRKSFILVRDDSETEKLHAEKEKTVKEIERLVTHQSNLKQERELLETTTSSFLSSSNSNFTNVATEEALSTISQYLNFNDTEHERIDDELFKVDQQLEEVKTRLASIKQQLSSLRAHKRKEKRTEVTIALRVHEAGPVKVALTYIIRGASWRASYDARVSSTPDHYDGQDENAARDSRDTSSAASSSSGSKLKLTYYAHISQSTGEDWNDVSLSLSTAEPSLTAGPPHLEPLPLSFRPAHTFKGYSLEMEEMKKCLDETIPVAMSSTAMLPPPAPPAPAPSSAPMRTASASVKSTGGDKLMTSTFQVQSRQPELLSNGEEHKVTITTLFLQTDMSYKCVPKVDQKAYLKTVTTNDSNFILLSGKVSVYFDQSFVSNTKINSVCPMETFDLFLGPDPAIDVRYDTPTKNMDSVGYFRVSNKATINKMITITNNKVDTPVIIELVDHMPRVSDANLKVTVQQPAIQYGTETITLQDVTLDNNHRAQEIVYDPATCHVSWRISINPNVKVRVPFVYSLEWAKNSHVSGDLM